MYKETKDALYQWKMVGKIMQDDLRQQINSQAFAGFFDGHSLVNEFPVAVLSQQD
ncbi:MAG: hypothetical protein IPL59_16780 [Candidatus Competibacteraceae bacterium]|uniref:Uncharacterized protein n=1 Tax=Candidatus Contendobacter odensis Run_B_J11 TaxID=1400861 RepID=A0A7U7G9K5_9GAMM|nr:hypothetical protein [Candidatus Competibacteraceae bacterium]CDH44447.1 hypothetical protein BN874_1680023 [Candidatus Contendobacter odensis Run_B_J11]